VLSVVVGTICGGVLVALVIADPTSALRAAPWLLLVAGACWAVFWRPEVVVDDSGVRLVNVTRTIDLPWPSIQAVDTKYALTLITAYGRFTGWAAPAPGALAARRATKQDTMHLPASTAAPGGIRPGDLPTSASGSAALLVRRHWERLRDDGFLDDPRLERAAPPITWHRLTLGVGAGLLVLAVVGLLV
jgi:hypothetical protein